MHDPVPVHHLSLLYTLVQQVERIVVDHLRVLEPFLLEVRVALHAVDLYLAFGVHFLGDELFPVLHVNCLLLLVLPIVIIIIVRG